MITIYFGPVPEEYLEDESHDSPYFTSNITGKKYYYEFSANEDTGITIKDTVGRYMPIEWESVSTLSPLLSSVLKLKTEVQELDDIRDLGVVRAYVSFEQELRTIEN